MDDARPAGGRVRAAASGGAVEIWHSEIPVDVAAKEPAKARGECRDIEEALDGPFVKTLTAGKACGVKEPGLAEAGEEGEKNDDHAAIEHFAQVDADEKLPGAGQRPEQSA